MDNYVNYLIKYVRDVIPHALDNAACLWSFTLIYPHLPCIISASEIIHEISHSTYKVSEYTVLPLLYEFLDAKCYHQGKVHLSSGPLENAIF